jgi:hypothetical protein
LGNFQAWTQKDMPEETLEKAKIEKILNQPLSEEEYQAIVLEPEIEEYDPTPNNEEPMVLQPLKEDSESEEDIPTMPQMPTPQAPKKQAPMPQAPMPQAPMPQAPVPQAPVSQAQNIPINQDAMPIQPLSQPVEPSNEPSVSEATEQPERKDVKKISFKK